MIGFLNVRKPRGITSHDVVQRVRRIYGLRQVGHGGTLDPLAEGVMVVALGKATRLIKFVRDDKIYRAGILLGRATDTDDTDGRTLASKDPGTLTPEAVAQALARFVGRQLQVPPLYSAIKKGGMKLYELARRGEAPDEIESREIEIFSLEVIEVNLPVVIARVHCSKGTYIRAIARDLGNALEVGACLCSLMRERSGPLDLAEAKTLEQLEALKAEGALASALEPIERVLELPVLEPEAELVRKLACGQTVDLQSIESQSSTKLAGDRYLVSTGKAPAMIIKRQQKTVFRPEVVLIDAADI